MDFINAIILIINFTVLPALTYGSQLALGAIFVTLIYGILRFANFATGDMMSYGTMFAVLLTYYFQSIGINFGFLPTIFLYLIIFMFNISLFFMGCLIHYTLNILHLFSFLLLILLLNRDSSSQVQ